MDVNSVSRCQFVGRVPQSDTLDFPDPPHFLLLMRTNHPGNIRGEQSPAAEDQSCGAFPRPASCSTSSQVNQMGISLESLDPKCLSPLIESPTLVRTGSKRLQSELILITQRLKHSSGLLSSCSLAAWRKPAVELVAQRPLVVLAAHDGGT